MKGKKKADEEVIRDYDVMPSSELVNAIIQPMLEDKNEKRLVAFGTPTLSDKRLKELWRE